MEKVEQVDFTPLHGRLIRYFEIRVVGSTEAAAVALQVDRGELEAACRDLVRAGFLMIVSDNN